MRVSGNAPRGVTLARPVTWSGIGIHTGARVQADILPADAGLVFVRRDLPGEPVVAARAAAAVPATHGQHTVLEEDGVRVATVEHVLSVLAGFGVTAARIVLDGEEVPDAGDGSVAPLAALVGAAGCAATPGAAPAPLVLREPFTFADGHATYRAMPAEGLSLHCVFEHPHPRLGRQEYSYALSTDTYVRDIAPARTFATWEEVEALRARGLARGGSLENAVVVGPDGPLGGMDWRFEGEAVRHKVLDVIGDLHLLGRPLHAAVRTERSGHRANVRFVAALEAWAAGQRVD